MKVKAREEVNLRRSYPVKNLEVKTYKRKNDRNHYIPETLILNERGEYEIQVLFYDYKWRQDTAIITDEKLKNELLNLKEG